MARGRKASTVGTSPDARKHPNIKWLEAKCVTKNGDTAPFAYPTFIGETDDGKLAGALAYFGSADKLLSACESTAKNVERQRVYNAPDPDQRIVDEITALLKTNPALFAARQKELTDALGRLAAKATA